MINPSVLNNIEFLKEGLKQPFWLFECIGCRERRELYDELVRFSDWEHQSLTVPISFTREIKLVWGRRLRLLASTSCMRIYQA